MTSIDSSVSRAHPPNPMLSALRRPHEAFAAGRRFAHVPRAVYIKGLERHVASDDPPLLICAPSGAGKSALVAYWAYTCRMKNPGTCVVEHYVGCGEEGTGYPDVIRRVMLEIRERFGVPAELPETPEKLVKDFPAWLWYVREPMILIVDAIDQMRDGSSITEWMPDPVPPTVRLIVTTTDENTRTELAAKGWGTMILEPFTLAERRGLVRRFVEEKKAGLTAAQQRAVVADAGSANPLLLRTRLEEARAAGGHSNVDEAISYYLGAATLEEMYDRLLGRLETDLDEGVVREVLSLFCTAKTGLAIEEIAAITTLSPEQVAGVIRRIEAYLLHIENRYTLFHVSLGKAAEHRWPDASSAATRLRLVDYFDAAPKSLRSIQEILGQLSEAREWRRLVNTVTDIPIFLQCYEHLQYELLRYWQQVDSTFDMKSEYDGGIATYRKTASSDELIRAIRGVGKLLEITGRMEGAEEMYGRARGIAIEFGNDHWQAVLQVSLGNLAAARGDYVMAEELLEGALEMMLRSGNRKEIAVIMNDRGRVAYFRGDFIRAQRFLKASLEQAEADENLKDATMILGNLGAVYVSLGRLRKGAECFRRMLAHAEQTGDIIMETTAVNNIGVVATMAGNPEEAYRMYRRSWELASAVGDKAKLATTQGNLGDTLMMMMRPEEALEHFVVQKRLAEELNDQRQLASAWCNIGYARMKKDEFRSGLRALDIARRIFHRIDDAFGLGLVFGRMGYLHLRNGNTAQAMESFVEQREVAERAGNPEFIVEASLGIGHVYRALEELDRAEEWYQRSVETAKETGNDRRAVEATGWLGVVACRRGEYDVALERLNSAVARSRKEHPTEELGLWLLEKASLLMRRVHKESGGVTAAEQSDLNKAAACIKKVIEMPICASDRQLMQQVQRLSSQLDAVRSGVSDLERLER